MRLFLALEPPATFRRAIARRVAERRDALPAASWVRESNLHLTLVFLGEVEEPALADVVAALESAQARAPARAVSPVSAGGFPERGRVRIVWLGLEPASELGGVAAAFRAAATSAGLGFDAKPFLPHLTLARCRRPWPGVWRERLGELVPEEPPAFVAERATLFSSVLGSGGPAYTPLAEFALAEAA